MGWRFQDQGEAQEPRLSAGGVGAGPKARTRALPQPRQVDGVATALKDGGREQPGTRTEKGKSRLDRGPSSPYPAL